MISLVAPKRSHAIEHCQMFNARRTSWLNPASENLFDAGYRDLDYNYEPSRQDYEPGRLVRSPEERNFRVIGAANQWLQPVPQKMSTTTSGAIKRIFYQRICDYNTVSGVFIWPNRDPLGEPGFEVMQRAAPYRAHSLVQGPAERIEGPNLYEYVRNNPIQYVDPLGLQVPPQVIQEIDEILSSPEAQAEEQAAETELATLMQQARDLYPKLCNKFQWHHITPKYLGGDPNGPLVLLEGPYHQLITNAFRNQWAYGQGVPPSTTVVNIVNTVYSQLPLPK
jgi:hypothetical protein